MNPNLIKENHEKMRQHSEKMLKKPTEKDPDKIREYANILLLYAANPNAEIEIKNYLGEWSPLTENNPGLVPQYGHEFRVVVKEKNN